VPRPDDSSTRSRPTSADVARLAGVSPTTVSLVLADKADRISDVTKEKVFAAVAQLDYRLNRTAQGLRHGRSATIGLITDHIGVQPYSGPIVSAAHDVTWENRQMILMVNTTLEDDRTRSAVEDLLARQVDGILFAAIGTRTIHVPAPARRARVALVNAFANDGDFPTFLPDERGGARALARHLVQLGHREIATLAGTREAWATSVRVQETQAVLRSAGLSLGNRLFYGDYTFTTGYSLAQRVLELTPSPTALICGNDQMAAGAYLALARHGLRVPQDMTVVGYDDEPVATMLTPTLTTVRLPFYELGRRATLALLGKEPLEPGEELIPTTLRIRESSAPPAS